MVIALHVNASGRVYQDKRPGTVLAAGDLIARLDLDDPSLVTKAQPYTGAFSSSLEAPLVTEESKLSQLYQSTKDDLDNILNGKEGCRDIDNGHKIQTSTMAIKFRHQQWP